MGQPKCVELKCDKAFESSFSQGTVEFTGDGSPDTTTMKITCKEGYVIKGMPTTPTKTFTCKKDGAAKVLWNDGTNTLPTVPPPSCVPRPCEKLTNPASGTYSKLEGVFEDTVTLTCEGEKVPTPLGADTVTCNKDGVWTPVASCKDVACLPITLTNGKVKDEEGKVAAAYPIGSKFKFECDTGFELSVADSYEITCEKNGNQPTGTYSAAFPTCANIDDCKGVDCQNGKCVDDVNKHVCSCNSGFTLGDGGKCDKATDPCADSPCKNNGVCSVNADYTPDSKSQYEYKCTCPEGGTFSGYDCEKDSSLQWNDQKYCRDGAPQDENQPHPGSCTKYINCAGFGTKTVKEQSCPDGQVFDSTTKECTLPANAVKDSKCTRNY